MHTQKISGVVALILGIGLIAFSLYVSNAVTEEVAAVNKKTEMATNNPLTRAGGPTTERAGKSIRKGVSNKANAKAKPYRVAVTWGYIGGAIFLVASSALLLFKHDKS
jgi:hypothetical protein